MKKIQAKPVQSNRKTKICEVEKRSWWGWKCNDPWRGRNEKVTTCWVHHFSTSFSAVCILFYLVLQNRLNELNWTFTHCPQCIKINILLNRRGTRMIEKDDWNKHMLAVSTQQKDNTDWFRFGLEENHDGITENEETYRKGRMSVLTLSHSLCKNDWLCLSFELLILKTLSVAQFWGLVDLYKSLTELHFLPDCLIIKYAIRFINIDSQAPGTDHILIFWYFCVFYCVNNYILFDAT